MDGAHGPLQATRTLELRVICRVCGPPTLLLEPNAGDRLIAGEGNSVGLPTI